MLLRATLDGSDHTGKHVCCARDVWRGEMLKTMVEQWVYCLETISVAFAWSFINKLSTQGARQAKVATVHFLY